MEVVVGFCAELRRRKQGRSFILLARVGHESRRPLPDRPKFVVLVSGEEEEAATVVAEVVDASVGVEGLTTTGAVDVAVLGAALAWGLFATSSERDRIMLFVGVAESSSPSPALCCCCC